MASLGDPCLSLTPLQHLSLLFESSLPIFDLTSPFSLPLLPPPLCIKHAFLHCCRHSLYSLSLPLGMFSLSFLFHFALSQPLSLSRPLSSLVLHPHCYGNRQLQLPPAPFFFPSLHPVKKKIPCRPPPQFSRSLVECCFLCLVAKVKPHI